MSRSISRRSSNTSHTTFHSVLESQSDSLSHNNINIDIASMSSISSTVSEAVSIPSMISTGNKSIKLKKTNSKKNRKKKSKVRTRTNNGRLNLNEARRRSKLSQKNIINHNKAIRPPNLLKSFSTNPTTFRTPQPKLRQKSRSSALGHSNSLNRTPKTKTNGCKAISVAIRLRPLNSGEIRNGMKPIWSVKGTTTLKQIRGTISSYNFEYVCPGIHDKIEGSTLNLYNAVAKRIVLSSCKGQNGTIFAYGQTSSGKTYTMLGTDTDPGVTLLALSDIFHFIRNDKERKYALFISYIEIHNEVINDLLNEENKNLSIVDTPTQGPVIKNCTEEAVKTPQDVIQLLLRGEKLRKVSETHSNERSSRSHAIFRIFIQSQLRNEKANNHKTLHSVLNLVDLAGSESSTNIDDQNTKQAKEAKHINQSLLYLGRVILALSSKQTKRGGYIPYRDSKLTRILQPSLGGNANTSVICTVSPCANCLDESLNTLRFAQFTTKVTNRAIINETIDDKSKLRKYQLLVKSLKQQINEYTKKSNKIELIYEKMKKLKKQNISLQTKIKKHKQNNVKMEEELNNLREKVSINDKNMVDQPSMDSYNDNNNIPSRPQTPKQTDSGSRFRRKRLFVSTAKETQSEPELLMHNNDETQFNHNNQQQLQSKSESVKSFQITINSGDERDRLSEYSVDRTDIRSITTPSSVQTTNQIDQFAKVILNLQDKLEQVQGNIETLTNRISTAQFVDINSIASPAKLNPPSLTLPPPQSKVMNSVDLTAKIMDETDKQHQETENVDKHDDADENVCNAEEDENAAEIGIQVEDIPVISIDLADEINGDTPELPAEDDASSVVSKRPTVFRTLSDDIEPLLPKELQQGNDYMMMEQNDNNNNKWKEKLYSEKKHSAQLLRMISGTKLLKLQSGDGKPYEVKLWLQVKHLLDDSKPCYQICWKKTFKATNENNNNSNNNDNVDKDKENKRGRSTINLSLLNSKLSKPNTLLLTSITSMLCGQQTQTFKNSNASFTEKDKELSFSLITTKQSIDFVCKNDIQYETWVECLDKLLSEQSEQQESSFLSEGSIKESVYSNNAKENINDCNHNTSKLSGIVHSSSPMANPFGSGATSLNTTMINEAVDNFLELDASYPLSPPKGRTILKQDSDDEIDPFNQSENNSEYL